MANEKKSITWAEIRWLILLGIVFFGYLFVLNAEGKLTLEVAINYTVFIMAFIGLGLSLIACGLSYMAYLDGKQGLEEVKRKLDELPGKIPQYAKSAKGSAEINWEKNK